ncbi:hypothetical protein FB45DRAFT_949433 [Roridomyces roridus]|uniref:Uncharacterized protein n=1 Tax=Roridomyces roridus TaxID=1738132 RepID=A0AAD7B1T3_9AGAR|nr:hypothetical protein FB45DRAFT_949433 [Roridomyces roridus]
MLLDTLSVRLSSEYDAVIDALLRGLASLAHYLLLRRVPLRSPGSWSRLPVVGIDETVADWGRALDEVKIHINAIQERWPEVMSKTLMKLETPPYLPFPFWLRWLDPYNTEAHIHKLTNNLANIMETATRDVLELMQACTGMGLTFEETRDSASANNLHVIETVLDALIELNTAFMRYRAGCWISNRVVFEQRRTEDLGVSPLNDLFSEEVDYVHQHKMMYVHYINRFNKYRFR